MKIENCVILITGGASGLGEHMAKFFSDKDAIVYICDVSEENGKKVEEESKSLLLNTPKIKFIKCDVTDENDVKEMFIKIKNISGRLDVLINSAGLLWTEDTVSETQTHSLEKFEKIWKINTYGAFNVSKHAAKLMIENFNKNKLEEEDTNNQNNDNGCIILVSSVSGIEGRAGKIAYSMSKAALIGMTLPMARDLGKWKIRVNTIAPLMIETPMIAECKNSEAGKKLLDCIPLKKFGKPENVSDLVELIIKNDYMNGEVIRIDGGGRLGNF